MSSERLKRQLDRLLDEAEVAVAARQWAQVQALCEHLLTLDPANSDALAFLAAAERGLARGDGASAPATDPSEAQTTTPAGPPAIASAERRQLTVFFCDLVDSTPLSGRLDPEDLREVVRAYQAACSAVLERFEGYIAQYLGDGVLVYFGYPQAHEDDALRAVRAGLALVAEVAALMPTAAGRPFGAQAEAALRVRVGIHTGLTVVGEMGAGARREQLALGETPNVAARLQGLAEPNSVVVSAATERLVRGFFRLQPLGQQPLKGVARPLAVWRVLGESGAGHRLDSAPALTPLVGRDEEVALLLRRWQRTRSEGLQTVVLSGEPGIGKTRLTRVLRERLEAAGEPVTRIELRGAQLQQHSALAPLVQHYQRLLGLAPGEPPDVAVQKLEAALAGGGMPLAEAAPLLAALLSLPLPERYPPLNCSPEEQRQRTLEVSLRWLLSEARRGPVLFVVEDLHWLDPSTLELVSLLVEQQPAEPILLLLTCRPEFVVPWPLSDTLALVPLGRLGRGPAAEVVWQVAGGRPLPAAVVDQILAHSDGVPLFVEELTRAVLESGLVQERAEQYELAGPLPPLAIPSTLHDSLMARLDRLATVKEVAQIGAVLGREFRHSLLAAMAALDEAALRGALDQLIGAGLLYRRGEPPEAVYSFKHALIQDAAYASLLRSRRQQLHAHAARMLTTRTPEVAETQPELVAHHFTEAGLVPEAIVYWQRAGEQASGRSANQEAAVHLNRGLQLLDQFPDSSERAHQELQLRIRLGYVLVSLKGIGSPDVEATFSRCLALSRLVGEAPELLPAIFGLYLFRLGRAQYAEALELAELCLRLAEAQEDDGQRVLACYAVTAARFFRGEFRLSREAAARGVALYNEQQHASLAAAYGRDFGVTCLVYGAWASFCAGYPDAARQGLRACHALARRLAHKHTLAFALSNLAYGYTFLRESSAALAVAEEAVALASEQRFVYWGAQANIFAGWALADLGRTAEGLARLGEGIAAWRAIGSVLALPLISVLHAEAYRNAGQIQEALATVEEGLRQVAQTGERAHESDLYRLRGELRSADDPAAAEADLRRAITVAQDQEAKLLELRAATSLARLWQQHSKPGEAHALLAPVYGWFTEGFDTVDLAEARALIEALSGAITTVEGRDDTLIGRDP